MEKYIPWFISGGSLLLSLVLALKKDKKDEIAEAKQNIKDEEAKYKDMLEKINNGILLNRENVMKANLKLDQVCVSSNELLRKIEKQETSIVEIEKRLYRLENEVFK